MSYAVVTAPHGGKDLDLFQRGGSEWVSGTYRFGEGSVPLYPPFALPVFSPLTLIPFDGLVYGWLALNLAAMVVVVCLTVRLFGAGWGLKEKFYLTAFFLSWAPLRVTLRLGQISLLVTALLLGALLARQKKRDILAGILLGLSLCKYPMTVPFLLYVLWKRQWKIVAAALLIPAVLTEVFSLRLGISAIDAAREYVRVIGEQQLSGTTGWAGTTEIKMLILGLTGGSESLTFAVTTGLAAAALIAMVIVFKRNPESERAYFAALTLFALWLSYHRTYDSVLCILVAALLIDFIRRGRFIVFSRAGLAGLALFILSIPGFLVVRLNLSESQLSANPLGFVGLHIERLLVFGLFWSLLVLQWRAGPNELTPPPSPLTEFGETPRKTYASPAS